MLSDLVTSLRGSAVIGLFPAYSEGDDVVIEHGDGKESTCHMLRQQVHYSTIVLITTIVLIVQHDYQEQYLITPILVHYRLPLQIKAGKSDVYVGTADFIGARGSGDHMGFFSCSVFGSVKMAGKHEEEGDDYNGLLVKSLADRLVSCYHISTFLNLDLHL